MVDNKADSQDEKKRASGAQTPTTAGDVKSTVPAGTGAEPAGAVGATPISTATAVPVTTSTAAPSFGPI